MKAGSPNKVWKVSIENKVGQKVEYGVFLGHVVDIASSLSYLNYKLIFEELRVIPLKGGTLNKDKDVHVEIREPDYLRELSEMGISVEEWLEIGNRCTEDSVIVSPDPDSSGCFFIHLIKRNASRGF